MESIGIYPQSIFSLAGRRSGAFAWKKAADLRRQKLLQQ
jgi:hypothetical protein